ncbi:hypothetical protein F5B21DRAFT_389910 [Xylaria acuta]|nr:hypothetical protein F5B21DRAFT_389910 [Xylaria acuta]
MCPNLNKQTPFNSFHGSVHSLEHPFRARLNEQTSAFLPLNIIAINTSFVQRKCVQGLGSGFFPSTFLLAILSSDSLFLFQRRSCLRYACIRALQVLCSGTTAQPGKRSAVPCPTVRVYPLDKSSQLAEQGMSPSLRGPPLTPPPGSIILLFCCSVVLFFDTFLYFFCFCFFSGLYFVAALFLCCLFCNCFEVALRASFFIVHYFVPSSPVTANPTRRFTPSRSSSIISAVATLKSTRRFMRCWPIRHTSLRAGKGDHNKARILSHRHCRPFKLHNGFDLTALLCSAPVLEVLICSLIPNVPSTTDFEHWLKPQLTCRLPTCLDSLICITLTIGNSAFQSHDF